MMEVSRRILIVEDEEPLRRLLERRLSRKGNAVDAFETGEDALDSLERASYDVALVDIRLPGIDGIEILKQIKGQGDTEVIILTGHGTIDSAISAMKLGAYDYLTKPCKLRELEIVIQKAHEKKKLREGYSDLKEELKRRDRYGDVIGRSAAVTRVMDLIERVSQTNSTVLVQGETGTGKELIANEIHRRSLRQDGPFIVIHCAALPETLQESELFGYEKGAFTGAVKQKRGLVELAHHGTLFVDEIGEIQPQLQVKLLRFLESGRFRRLGGEQEHRIDARIVAATNRDLLAEIEEGRFREDLYYRLKVVNVQLPPLRKRKEDIPLLADHLLERIGAKKQITRGALDRLAQYDWPGNVRELANTLEVAAALCKGNRIRSHDVAIQAPSGSPEAWQSLSEMEKVHIRKVLASCGGNKTKTAKILGISLRNLYRKIDRYGLAS
jgi:DNA-binding NtrC family response regulator